MLFKLECSTCTHNSCKILNSSCYRPRERGFSLLRGVDGEGEGPESVIVGAHGVAEGYSARLGKLVFLNVQLVEELGVERDVQQWPQATPFSYPRGTSTLPVVGSRGSTCSLFRNYVTDQCCSEKIYVYMN